MIKSCRCKVSEFLFMTVKPYNKEEMSFAGQRSSLDCAVAMYPV
jgi:hypothetical protein